MGSDLYFYNQTQFRKISKRHRKMPEELPESLRFAHLNPKLAAILANKERNLKHDADPFGEGASGKKSLLPDINQAFNTLKSGFDATFLNDEDSQRYLFEEAKMTSVQILQQLARIIYFYEDLKNYIPKSLEYQLMAGYKELTSDVIVVHRDWQTAEMKEQYQSQQKEAERSDEEGSNEGGDVPKRPQSRLGTERSFIDPKTKKSAKPPKIIEPSEDGDGTGRPESNTGMKRSSSRSSLVSKSRIGHDSRVGGTSRAHRGSSMSSIRSSRASLRTKSRSTISGTAGPSPFRGRGARDDIFSVIGETPSDPRCPPPPVGAPAVVLQGTKATALANPASFYQVIQFQYSSKVFEDKVGKGNFGKPCEGWIIQKGREDEVDQNAVLEYCVQKLQVAMKEIAAQKGKEIEQGFDKHAVIRYYGDTRKEALLKYRKSPVKSTPSPVFKGGKPRIPTFVDERNEGKKLMQATHLDGSTIIYYPSGRPAIIYSAAGFGRPGYYTIVYEDGLDAKMMACFTPSGKGVCYHPNGVVKFLSTEKGGHVAELTGAVERKWKWPISAVKLLQPISLQVTNHLGLRCTSQSSMSVVFNCQKESARFSISPTFEAEEYKPGTEEQLLTAFTFSSRAAKDLMRIFAPKQKMRKSKGKKYGSRSQMSSEVRKLLEDMPDKVMYDIEADKELARLQRKARNLIDDWMEHYRIAVGLTSPALIGVQDMVATPRKRNIKSAVTSDYGVSLRRAMMGLETPDLIAKKHRIPSAPLTLDKELTAEEEEALVGKRREGTTVKFEDPNEGGGDAPVSHSAMAMLERLTESAGGRSGRSKPSSAGLSLSRHPTSISSADRGMSAASRSHCPLTVRQQILGYDRPQCRCSRHHVPFIMDIEFEEFINHECPEGQLIVIAIVSSLFPGVTKAEEMITEIYTNQNRNRTRPCIQGRSDMFRILKYDVNTAAQMSDHTTPLLMTRHNAIPGMFLMYMDGKLLFCDHIFNGYGNARKDFKKQVMKSRLDAIQGYSLPKDFRFSPSKGRSGPRSAWGGEIGGAGVDKYGSPGTTVDTTLLPIHRPTSSTSGDSKEIQVENQMNDVEDFGPFAMDVIVRLKALVSRQSPARKSLENTARLISLSLSSTGYQQSPIRIPQYHTAPDPTPPQETRA